MTSHDIPWFTPLLDEADAEAVKQQVLSGFVNEGPANRAFEKLLTQYFSVPFAVTTPNCTIGLAMSLMAIGVQRGDSVLVPDITFIGTASAVRLAGAEPILVDVDPDTFTMDPDDAKRRILPSTKAILPVHLNGRSANLSALRTLAAEKGLGIVEDAAEALGSRNSEGFLGTLSEAGCFSFAPTKIITSGQGGFILTHRQEVRDNLIRLKDHGRLSRASDVHPVTGYNLKVTDMQAALAISQWNKLSSRIARCREIDHLYREGLSDLPAMKFTARELSGGYLMWPDFKCRRRNDLVTYMAQHRITARPCWPAIHTQPAYFTDRSFPGSTEVTEQMCWLPCSPGITEEEIHRVIAVIRSFHGGGSA